MKNPSNKVLIIFAVVALVAFLIFSQKKLSSSSTTPIPENSDTQEQGPTITKKNLNIRFRLPEGWAYKTEYRDFVNEEQVEVYTFSYGDYQLVVGQPTTGRASCNDIPKAALFRINNPALSTTLYRAVPSKDNLSSDSTYKLDVCSAWIGQNFEHGTKIGLITYILPRKYDHKILSQMDQLLESIKL